MAMMSLKGFWGLLIASALILASGALCQYGPPENEIISLPGYEGDFPSQMFSGYINVPGTEKELYYWLVLSQGNPEQDPLVLWLNGGPGCSSIGGGVIEEHGPFVYSPSPDTGLLYESMNLSVNPYSWNKVATMLYIDSPAGTGLSYSTNPMDYNTDDYQAVQDMHDAIVQWFTVYPAFKTNDFYITGESYAGIYVPLTANLILASNDDGGSDYINLMGYAIGNPSTGVTDSYDTNGVYQGFNLIPQPLYEELNSEDCPLTEAGFNASAVGAEDGGDYSADSNAYCTGLQDEVTADTSAVFPYSINKPCFYGQQVFNSFYFNQTKARLAEEGIMWQDELSLYQPDEDYCDYDDRIAHFVLNNQEYRDSLHIAPFANETQSLAGFFEMCTQRVNFTHEVPSTIPYHMANIEQGLRVLVYTGDHDTVVPLLGTQKWTSELGQELGLLQDWSPWWYPHNPTFGYEIGGYVTQYNGLDYVTIRSAGHQVPTTSPMQALFFFENWLSGNLNATTVQPDNLVLTNLFPTSGDDVDIASYR